MTLAKPLEQIQETDLQELVADQVREGKEIDYKQAFKIDRPVLKDELRRDITSFANSSGGNLIFGMKEKGGIPTEVCGLEIPDEERLVQDVQQVYRSSHIKPQIPGIGVRVVPIAGKGPALIVRIPKSFAAPHQVTITHPKEDPQFWYRDSSGKVRMQVDDLRLAFTLSETLSERVRAFRLDRLGQILSGETPIPMADGAKLVLHLVPLSAFDPAFQYDLRSIGREHMSRLSPLYTGISGHRHNFDGFLLHSGYDGRSGGCDSYVQIFRSGCIEAVEASLLRGDRQYIPSVTYEQVVLEALPRYLSILKDGVPPPVVVMLSFLNVRSFRLSISQRLYTGTVHLIDRDVLPLPEAVVDTFDADPAQVMRPAFDAVWNAGGWPQSLNYDDTGKWVGK